MKRVKKKRKKKDYTRGNSTLPVIFESHLPCGMFALTPYTKFSLSILPHISGGSGGSGIVGTTNSTEKIEYLTSAKYAETFNLNL